MNQQTIKISKWAKLFLNNWITAPPRAPKSDPRGPQERPKSAQEQVSNAQDRPAGPPAVVKERTRDTIFKKTDGESTPMSDSRPLKVIVNEQMALDISSKIEKRLKCKFEFDERLSKIVNVD